MYLDPITATLFIEVFDNFYHESGFGFFHLNVMLSANRFRPFRGVLFPLPKSQLYTAAAPLQE